MKLTHVSLITVAVIALSGCGTTTGERTGTGAVLGAATGAAIGSFSGNAGKGALIGAGVGALGGYAYDDVKRKEEEQQATDSNSNSNSSAPTTTTRPFLGPGRSGPPAYRVWTPSPAAPRVAWARSTRCRWWVKSRTCTPLREARQGAQDVGGARVV